MSMSPQRDYGWLRPAGFFDAGDFVPLNHTSMYATLTDAQYVAIGKVVVEWANIEQLLSQLLARLLLSPDFLARTFTDPFMAARLQESIKEAVAIHISRYGERLIPRDTLDEIIKLNGSVSALRKSRNKIAHYCWFRQSDELMFGTSFAGGVPTKKYQSAETALLSLDELAKINEEAFNLVEQLIALLAKVPEIDEDRFLRLLPSIRKT